MLEMDLSLADKPSRNYKRVAYEVLAAFGLFIGIIISTGFGFGLNGSFPFLAFLQIPLVQLLLHRRNTAIHYWVWTILKFIMVWIALALGYTLGFAHSFPDPNSPIIVLGIAAVIGILHHIFVYIPSYRLWRLFKSHTAGWRFVVLSMVLPILYTAFWFLFPMVLPIGDFPHPAYSQVDVRSIIMFAAFFGLSGICFILSWTGMGIFIVLWSDENRAPQKNLLMKSIVLTFILVTTCASLQTTLSTGNFYQKDNARTTSVQHKVGCLLSGDYRNTEQLLKADPTYSMIVWSELSSNMDNETTTMLQLLAKSYNVSIVTAYSTSTDSFNWAALIDNTGELKFSYKKRHPVPGVEDNIVPGPGEIFVADTSIGKVSTAICFDLDFPQYIATTPRSAEYLVQPSETWGAIGEYHARINAVRSIEHGFTLIRCAADGYSGVFTPDGKWINFYPDDYNGAYSMILPDSPRRVFTLYGYIGDAFAWLCVGLAVLLLICSIVPSSVYARFAIVFNRERRYQLLSE
jgi:apolipoprotein N-acyltransferase